MLVNQIISFELSFIQIIMVISLIFLLKTKNNNIRIDFISHSWSQWVWKTFVYILTCINHSLGSLNYNIVIKHPDNCSLIIEKGCWLLDKGMVKMCIRDRYNVMI